MSENRRFVRTLLALVFVALAGTLLVAAPANAGPSQLTATSFWSCTSDLPGYTYDQVTRNSSCGGLGLMFHMIVPTDQALACQIPNGFVHDRAMSAAGICGLGLIFRLRVPSDGLWACEIPPGFTYDQVANTSGGCSAVGSWLIYHLRAI